jgi:hypothetical protein
MRLKLVALKQVDRHAAVLLEGRRERVVGAAHHALKCWQYGGA